MNCRMLRVAVLLSSIVCTRVYGAWVAYNGNGYDVLCEVDGNEAFSIREKRVVDGGFVEQSEFTLVGTNPHPLRNMALSYIERFRRSIDSVNAVGSVTNNVDCNLKENVCAYSFGAERASRHLSSWRARRFEVGSRQFVDSCRQLIEEAGYDERMIYYRQRYKKGKLVFHAKYEDVVCMSHLYSGISAVFPVRVSLCDDSLKLEPPGKRDPVDGFMFGRWPELESVDIAAYNWNTNRTVFVEGGVLALPNGGLVSMGDWRVHENFCLGTTKGVVPDGDEFLSLEYLSPCQEFKLLLREDKRIKYVTYCCGILSIVQSTGDVTCVCAGFPYDLLDRMYVDLSGHVIDAGYSEVKHRLKRLAAALDRDLESPVYKTKRYSTIIPIVKDAKRDERIYALVEELRSSAFKDSYE